MKKPFLAADALSDKKRVMLWLGGGARHAGEPVASLIWAGVVNSVQGRGIFPEDNQQSSVLLVSVCYRGILWHL